MHRADLPCSRQSHREAGFPAPVCDHSPRRCKRTMGGGMKPVHGETGMIWSCGAGRLLPGGGGVSDAWAAAWVSRRTLAAVPAQPGRADATPRAPHDVGNQCVIASLPPATLLPWLGVLYFEQSLQAGGNGLDVLPYCPPMYSTVNPVELPCHRHYRACGSTSVASKDHQTGRP